MPIKRTLKKKENYYIVEKRVREDARLSWAARGLLIFLLGKPDDWTITVPQLVAETENTNKPSGRDAVYAIINELKQFGYIKKTALRNGDGKYTSSGYLIFERPLEAE